jgi:hypothetical protein
MFKKIQVFIIAVLIILGNTVPDLFKGSARQRSCKQARKSRGVLLCGPRHVTVEQPCFLPIRAAVITP